MVHPMPRPETTAGMPPLTAPLTERLTPCDETALRRLMIGYGEARPLSVLIGKSASRCTSVVREFLAGLDDDVDKVHFKAPCQDATSCMRDIVQRLGFERKDFSLTDLESIFKMYLAYQKTHGRRTVLCFEQAEDSCSWVLDKISCLARMEAGESLGLYVVLSGSPALSEAMQKDPLAAIAEHTGRHVPVAPLTPAETREFVRQLLEKNGIDDPGQVIEYEAIEQLHKASAGIPDLVPERFNRSWQLAEQQSAFPITAKLVERAGQEPDAEAPSPPAELPSASEADETPRPRGRLIVHLDGEPSWVQPIDGDSLSNGRDTGTGVQLASKLVSRNHAVLVMTPTGVRLMDLGSTNGTFVNGRKVKCCFLQNGDKLSLGDCRIEYREGTRGLDEAGVGFQPPASKPNQVPALRRVT